MKPTRMAGGRRRCCASDEQEGPLAVVTTYYAFGGSGESVLGSEAVTSDADASSQHYSYS